MINSILALLAQFEEISKLILRLRLWVKIHVKLFLQIRPRLRILSLLAEWPLLMVLLVKLIIRALRLIPLMCSNLLLAEVCRLISVILILFFLLILIELPLCLLMFPHLLVKDVEVSERLILQGLLLIVERPLHQVLSLSLLRRQLLITPLHLIC